MPSNGRGSLRQAGAIALDPQKISYQSQIGGVKSQEVYGFRLTQRSSLDLKLNSLGTANAELIQDRNRNWQVDRGEVIARSRTTPRGVNTIKLDSLKRGTYFVRVLPKTSQQTDYRLVLSTAAFVKINAGPTFGTWEATQNQPQPSTGKPSQPTEAPTEDGSGPNYRLQKAKAGYFYLRDDGKKSSRPRRPRKDNAPRISTNDPIPTDSWNARFINRTRRNYADYQNYDFRNPSAVINLGSQGKNGSTIANLKVNYGRSSPQGVNSGYFAMEAWTRIRLEEGKFYKLTSASDDGTRFLLKDSQTGRVVSDLGGDWRNRRASNPAWSQIISAPQSSPLDFYVQYYEKWGDSTINVSLTEVQPRGRVAVSSEINLRSQPTSLYNNPIGALAPGDAVTVLRKVKSSNDRTYPEWYEVSTADGRRGFVAANLITVDGVAGSVTGGGIPTDNGNNWNDGNNSGNNNGGSGGNPWNPNPNPGGGFPTGGSTNPNKGFTFSTSISKENPYYKDDLGEIMTPKYYNSSYKPMIEELTASVDWLQPSIIAAIGSRESGWGLLLSPPGPSGTGDGGHGRGLMQIDDRFHTDFINSGKWRDPKENLRYAINDVLKSYYSYLSRNTNLKGFDLLRGTIAAYNAGPGNVVKAVQQGQDVDYYTTGRDYSKDVIDRAGWFQLYGWV